MSRPLYYPNRYPTTIGMFRGSIPSTRNSLGSPAWMPLQDAVVLASAQIEPPKAVIELNPLMNSAETLAKLVNKVCNKFASFFIVVR